MSNKVKIAIDAMGGENSPDKIINGIEISLKTNKDNFFYLFGKKEILKKIISKKKFINQYCEIVNADDSEDPKAKAAIPGKVGILVE